MLKTFFLHIANSIRQRIKVLRQEYQTIGNAEMKLGLDVNHYMGKCSPTNFKDSSQKIKLTPGDWGGLTVLTQSQKLQVLKELFLSLNDAGKVTCCNKIFFKEKSVMSKMIMSLLKSILSTEKNMQDIMTIMDEAFLSLAMKNGLTSNPKYFVSTSIMAMKRLSSEKQTKSCV